MQPSRRFLRERYRDLRSPLPPLDEQKRIVARLNEQLAAAEKARKAAEELLDAARALPNAFLRCALAGSVLDDQPGGPIIGQSEDLRRLRHHAALELRLGPAIHPRADVDTLPPNPRRARGGGGGTRRRGRQSVQASAASPVPLAGLGGAGRGQADRAAVRRPGRRLPVRQRRPHSLPPRAEAPAGRHAPAAAGRRDHGGRRRGPHRHRKELPRRAGRGARDTGEGIDAAHVFTLSQAYEGLLLRMGEKNNDGGQFFTPRQVIRAMVRAIDPKIGETVYDPGCGTGRLPGAVLRAHARRAGGRRDGGAARATPRQHLLRPREGKPHLPHHAGQPRPARDRPAQHLARQHPHQERDLRRPSSALRRTSSTSS